MNDIKQAIQRTIRKQRQQATRIASEQVQTSGSLMEGVVLTPPPALSVKLLGNEKLVIPAELLVVAEHLTRYERIVTLEHTEAEMRNLGDGQGKDLVSGDGTIFTQSDEREAPHYDISSFKYEYIKLRFEDVLKAGDKVLVMSFYGNQKYAILDRLVSYGGDG